MVIFNHGDHICKVNSVLGDTAKLDAENLEICQKCENRLVCFVRVSLLKKKLISNAVHQHLFPTVITHGILYGLPKVHQTNCPVRPILSAIGAYNYKFAEFLVPLLQPLTSNQLTFKNCFSFVNEISSL